MHGRFSNLFRQKALATTYQHTKGLFPYQGTQKPGIALFRCTARQRLWDAKTAFMVAKFAINPRFWPHSREQQKIPCGSELAREGGTSVNILIA
jgi:hypothetical protein